MNELVSSVAGLPVFLLYFGLALVLILVFLVIYTWVTPYDELTLIRSGDAAAAVSLSGALIGFVLPLASAITHSVSWLDMVIWGAIALVVQIVVFFAVSRALPQLSKAISEGGVGQATLLAAVSVAVGIVNAACMTT